MRYAENFCKNTIDWKSSTTTPWKDDVCAKYADTAATTIERFGTTIATLFVKTTDDCPSNEEGPGGSAAGAIARHLAPEAWPEFEDPP